MKERSATLALSPTRYARLARTVSSTPSTRRVSFWYRSITLGIFSLANHKNHPAWPKYGLVQR